MSYTPMGDANWAIRAARRRHAAKRWRRWRLSSPIQLIDSLLEEVEQMNLRSARRVPIAWDPRLATLLASLPAGIHVDPAELRTGISPSRLLEALFGLQDQLLDLKIGPRRRELLAREEREEELARLPDLSGAA
jgi:hypothetical protein